MRNLPSFLREYRQELYFLALAIIFYASSAQLMLYVIELLAP